MTDYPCKGKIKVECQTDANCNWTVRGCIKHAGVKAGKRFRYSQSGVRQEIVEGMSNLRLNDPGNFDFEFNYDPELDPVKQPLDRKFLASGAYGATFIPAFPCASGKVYPKSLGKVFHDGDGGEWDITMKLKEIEKNQKQKYFTYPREKCVVNYPTGNTKAEKKLVKYLTSKKKTTGPLEQYIMDYSGYTLSQYFEKYYPTGSVPRGEFITIIENLFYAVKRLSDYNYVHQDIKEANIVISNTNRLRLIDFGLTIDFKDYYDPEHNLLLEVPYHGVAPSENYLFQLYDLDGVDYNTIVSWLPNGIEDQYKHFNKNRNVTLLNVLNNFNEQVKERLMEIVRDLNLPNNFSNVYLKCFQKDNFDDLYNLFPNLDTTSIREITKQIMPIMNKCLENKINYYRTNNFAKKTDIYSIGTMILRLYEYILPSSQDLPDQVKLFRDLLEGILNINPEQRFDINQALEIVKQMVAYKDPTTKKIVRNYDPFRKNIDPPEVKNIFLQFGKKKMISDLRYLLGL
jgi:serine/threonine protein kinase